MNDNQEEFQIFEKSVSGKHYDLLVDLKFTFLSATEVLPEGDSIEFFLGENLVLVDHEVSALTVEVVGDIMPEGFVHTDDLSLSDNHSNPVLSSVMGKIFSIQQDVIGTYFNQLADLSETGNGIICHYAFEGQEAGKPTTKLERLGFIMAGVQNAHPHWLGKVPN